MQWCMYKSLLRQLGEKVGQLGSGDDGGVGEVFEFLIEGLMRVLYNQTWARDSRFE